MILDPPNALFNDDWLVHDDVPEDLIEQVTVGVDPSGGGDKVGIVACALLNDGRYAVRWPTAPRAAARRSGATRWSNAMTTSMLTMWWSKSISAATWRPRSCSRPPSVCISAVIARLT